MVCRPKAEKGNTLLLPESRAASNGPRRELSQRSMSLGSKSDLERKSPKGAKQ
jgi:hypothetical protein